MPFIKRLTHCLTGIAAAGATLIATLAVSTVPAEAGRDFRYRGAVGNAYFDGYRRGARDWRFNRGGRDFRFNRGGRWIGGGRFDNRRHFYRGGRGLGRTEAAIIGAGVGVLGLALLNQNRINRTQGTVIVQQPVVVPPPVNAGYPQQVYNAPVAPAVPAGQCLQIREYQTTVIIAGTPREAYGNACLQPDGSWRQGPAVVVP